MKDAVMNILKPLVRVARRVPLLREVAAARAQARRAPQFVAPGHFHSPIPAIDDIRNDHARLFREPRRSLPGIRLNELRQLELLHAFKPYYADLDFPERKSPGHRYFYENAYYSYSDAIFLYCMLRHLRPLRIIEVGSGYSSCVTLDTNQRFFGGRIRCTFIEPHPDRLISLLEPVEASRLDIMPCRLQDVPIEQVSKQLGPNDVLFIDSTHVAKVGSDVNYIFTELFPSLSVGVYVHLHDIFYPFEYPSDWIYEGRAWSEAYLLRAFLSYNRDFEIVLFNTFLEHFHRGLFATHFPLCLRNPGGSIWLRRVAVSEDL
jgi:hypothetical protein